MPVYLKVIGKTVGMQLSKCSGKGPADLLGITMVSKNKLAFAGIAVHRWILIYFDRDTFPAPNKSEIKFFRIAVPFQYVFVILTFVVQQCRQYL